MKITKSMVNEELRSNWLFLNLFSFLLSRNWGVKLFLFMSSFSNGKNSKKLHCEERYIPSNNGGPAIRVRLFKPLDSDETLPALLYLHGGGYIAGNPEIALPVIEKFIATRPCLVIAPDYRKSLGAPYPAAFNDCYDTLLWAKDNASSLGIKYNKFIVAGHSAGGGLTAAVTLKARDTEDVSIAFQMPIYPMIDDRQTSESARNMDAPVWSSKNNAFAWGLYLKNLKDHKQDIPSYAAAARNDDYENFPPTITFVGELEPFKDETIAYVDALEKAGIAVTFKLYKGCFHGFDLVAVKSSIAKDAIDFTYRAYADYYDAYIE